ncbi:hypothetical protein N7466_009716 [Penicillium verhagenii]|uniref:uncharacterized protein n=1 Tax=Penicillium verhagenii TaxID=1562060 RepID=UPI002545B4C6|nr:uncharacterized protein N7466_009716 [Penicillium verhagenii]KAJ5921390.1 hypothetical protein N7466_009716 [Penicillium verhagenii]
MVICSSNRKSGTPKVWPKVQQETWVQFDQINHTLVNLEGLADNSLLLTVSFDSPKSRMKGTGPGSGPDSGLDWCSADDLEYFSTKLRIRHQTYGWDQGAQSNGGPLYEYLTKGLDGEQILQLRLPSDRIEGWQTVSLILLTYRKINPAIWHRVRSRLHNSEVAGLDWSKIEDELGSKHVWAFANVKAPARTPRLDGSDAETNVSNLAARFGLEDKPTARGFAAADISKAPGRKHKDLDSSDLGFKSL